MINVGHDQVDAMTLPGKILLLNTFSVQRNYRTIRLDLSGFEQLEGQGYSDKHEEERTKLFQLSSLLFCYV